VTKEKFMNRLNSIRAGMGMLKRAAVLALITTVAACTAGGPATTTTQQTTPGTTTTADYKGPAAKNADVTAFMNELWVNVRGTDRCGQCHSPAPTGTSQAPMFARSDDVNAAYDAVMSAQLINRTDPKNSRFVTKQAPPGHNCWLGDAQSCSDTMLSWINKYLGSSAGSVSTDPPLTAPPPSDVTGGKQFPDSPTDPAGTSFSDTVYPLLTQFCSGCHASSQTPYFASPDIKVAYAAAQAKINLNSPDQSRFVVRLRDEHHNCWDTGTATVPKPGDCDGSAALMLARIKAFADPIAAKPIDTTQVLSMALKMKDGTVASGGPRSEANLIAKYEFKTGIGTTAYDTSGVAPAADLQFGAGVSWVGGWGINIASGGSAKALTATSAKLARSIKSSGEYSIEAWVAPANIAQTNAWIVTYSGSDKTRNVTLGQQALQYSGATRSDKTDANGGTKPVLSDKANSPAQAALQHVVLTYDAVNGQKLYVNGVDTKAVDTAKGGSLSGWDDTFALVMGAETTGKEQWLGVIKFVAIHSRALTADQVTLNYNAGVGEKYFMLFDVTALSGVPQSYIKVTGSVLDSYAYQFSSPTFVSLNPTAVPANVPLKGIRIGVNGVELGSGQSYATVNTTIGGSSYTAAAGQPLSSVGAVVASDKGVDTDMFFLSFEQIGQYAHAHTEAVVPAPKPGYPTVPPSNLGVKNFAQINAALSSITGVPTSTAAVNTLYNTLQQSLPPTNELGAFLASHQTAISALADQYCNIAVNTNTTAMFPGLTLTNANAATYFATQANRNFVIDPLVARAIGTNVNTTVETAVRTELNSLIPTLAAINSTTAGRTASITQAACTAVLGSAAVSLQ
jgi:hypothetical protein